MKVSEQDQKLHARSVAITAATAAFLGRYQAARNDNGDRIACFDSAVHSVAGEVMPGAFPEPLQAIFDSAFCRSAKDRDDVLKGIEFGITEYRRRNGGDMPSPSLVASAISAGAAMLNSPEDDTFISAS